MSTCRAASPGAETFLRVRLSRIAAAADDAIAAAAAGDRAQVPRHLHRFGLLTSALWTGQQAAGHRRPVGPRQAGEQEPGFIVAAADDQWFPLAASELTLGTAVISSP